MVVTVQNVVECAGITRVRSAARPGEYLHNSLNITMHCELNCEARALLPLITIGHSQALQWSSSLTRKVCAACSTRYFLIYDTEYYWSDSHRRTLPININRTVKGTTGGHRDSLLV